MLASWLIFGNSTNENWIIYASIEYRSDSVSDCSVINDVHWYPMYPVHASLFICSNGTATHFPRLGRPMIVLGNALTFSY